MKGNPAADVASAAGANSAVLARLYLWFALPAAVILCFLVPPFQGADEAAHFYRVAGLATGQFISIDEPGTHPQSAGGMIDSAYGDLVKTYATRTLEARWYNDHGGSLATARAIRRTRHDVYTVYSNTALYPPTLYLPAVAAAVTARSLDLPLLYELYLERLVGGLFAVAVIGLCLRHFGAATLPMMLIALCPTVLYQSSVVTIDTLLVALFFLFALLTYRVVVGADGSRRETALLVATCVLLGPSKLAYVPLAVVPVLAALWADRRVSPRGLILAGAAVLSIALWAIWTHGIYHQVYNIIPGATIDMHLQLQTILHAPFVFARMLAVQVIKLAPHLMLQMFGIELGYPPVQISSLYVGILIVLVAAATLLHDRAVPMRRNLVVVVAAICLFIHVEIYVLLYLQFNPVGAARINGVQGRYFLPLLVMLVPLLPKIGIDATRMRWLQRIAIGWSAVGIVVTFVSTYDRFW